MPAFLDRIKKKFLEILPAVLYFFFAMTLFKLTFGWMMRAEGGPELMTFTRIIIVSLVIGKIMLIADAMPFLNKFSTRPLIYNTVWKTSIYSLFGFLFIFLEKFFHFVFKYHNWGTSWLRMMDETPWPRFWTAQIWLVLLFLFFVVFRELHIALGKGKMREIFFGK